MSDYNVITGIKVKDLAGNPANVKEGEVWYNTSTSKIRVRSTGTLTAWSSVNDLNLGRSAMQAGFGTATAAAAVSGVRTPYPTFDKTETEIWNGTNWTEVNDVNVGRYNQAGGGVVTAGIFFAGYNLASNPRAKALTEIWNGTNWTEVNDLNGARSLLAGDGTSTSALGVGGDNNFEDDTESWNGTNWTEITDPNTARQRGALIANSNTAALYMGGNPTPAGTPTEINLVETWNGSSWTEVNDMGNDRSQGGASGTTTAGIALGGIGAPGKAETWNGTNWAETAEFSRYFYGHGCAGANTTTGLVFGGTPYYGGVESLGESPGVGSFDITSS